MSLEEKRGLARAAMTGTLLFVAIGAHANPTGPAVVAGPNALPSGGVVAHGQATLNSQGSVLTVTNTPGAIINWQSFSIGSSATTNFVQQSASSTVLNRVVSQNVSTIAGRLLSNGHVFLTNPNGVLISSGAQINAASFTATTSAISDANFLAGNTQWSGEGSFVSAEGLFTLDNGTLSISPSGITNTGNIDFGGTGTVGGNLSFGTSGAADFSGVISLHSGNLILPAPLPIVTSGITTTGSLSLPGAIFAGGTVLLTNPNVRTGGTITLAGTGGTLTTGQNISTGGTVLLTSVLPANGSVSLASGSGLTLMTAGGTTGSNSGTLTLTSQQGGPSTSGSPAATTSISAPVQTAAPQTSIQSASAGSSALIAGRNVIATANAAAIPQPRSAPAALAAAPRSSAVGATISLQKREPMF